MAVEAVALLYPAGTKPAAITKATTRARPSGGSFIVGSGHWKLSRRSFLSLPANCVLCSAVSAAVGVQPPPGKGETCLFFFFLLTSSLCGGGESDMERLEFKKEGYNFWNWRGHKIHYIAQGEGRPVLLIHGFGASSFHWRYNIPELAKQFRVYAMDLLGFGLSDKALVEYNSTLWRDQVADFVKEVAKEPAVLVGNSIGGFTVLNTAAVYPELVSGLVLLNSSGQFEAEKKVEEKPVVEQTALQRLVINPVQQFGRRWLIYFTFWQARQPARIRSVLNNVYKDKANVDDYLVDSIVLPTSDQNAGEVYYRLMSSFMLKPSSNDLTLDKLLSRLSCPLLLLWGDLDPWVGPGKADKIVAFYPNCTLVRLQAGHCPHDEVPAKVNLELVNWISALPTNS